MEAMLSDNPEIPLPQDEEAGAAFRAQMAAYDLTMKYWKEGVAVVVVVLAIVLVYSLYMQRQQTIQRAWTGEIATLEADLPEVVRLGLTRQNLSDDDRASTREVADRISEIGRQADGVAAAEAWLKAAEYYRIADEKAQRRAALDSALPHAEGLLRYSAVAALANLDVEEGEGERAVGRLRELEGSLSGFLGEQVAFDIAATLESLDKDAEAMTAWDAFLAKYPTSSMNSEAAARKARLASAP